MLTPSRVANFFNCHAIRTHIARQGTTRADRDSAYEKAQDLLINAGDKSETSELCAKLAQGFLRSHDPDLAISLMGNLAEKAGKDIQPHHRLAIDNVGRSVIDLAPNYFEPYRNQIMKIAGDDITTQTLMTALTIRNIAKLDELSGPHSRAKDLAPSQG